MRLSEKEREVIVNAVRTRFAVVDRILLFGSRTDDLKRGGDVDILVETPLSQDAAFHNKLMALTDIQLQLGERKIDLVTCVPEGDDRLIVREARSTGVPLWTKF